MKTLIKAVEQIQELLEKNHEGCTFEISAEWVTIVHSESGEFVVMEASPQDAIGVLTK